MTARCYVVADDGTETDITDGVGALYDLVVGSMDWGSGFLTVEDATPVSVIAHACGYENAAEVDEYLAARTQETESAAWQNDVSRYKHSDHTPDCDREACAAGRLCPAAMMQGVVHLYHAPGYVSARSPRTGEAIPHQHVYSSVGRCMWPGCKQGRQ